jgi:pimeloyl-ACP methyl ester carboxylesterase
MITDSGIAYETAGDGDPPLVFVHGWSGDHTHLEPQFHHFADSHRVIALDLRGHGASRPGPDGASHPGPAYDCDAFADDVLAVVAHAGVARPVVVGHSLGGLVALTCAARPDAVAAAVLVDPAPMLPGRGQAFFSRSIPNVAADRDGSWRAAFVARLFGPHDTVRRDQTVTAARTVPLQVALGGWRAIAEFDGEGVLARVEAPVLLITAGAPEAGVVEQLGDVALGRTVGAGHFIQLEVPDQVNAMIARWLDVQH